MEIKNPDNHAFVERVKMVLRHHECIIETTEVDGGKTLHIVVRYFTKGVKLKETVDEVRRIYSQMSERFLDKTFLLIVEDETERETFDPQSHLDWN